MATELTQYGFRMEAMTVTRVASFNGYAVIWVETATKRIEIATTPKGRKIIVRELDRPLTKETA